MAKDLRVRRSLLELQTQCEQGNKKPLEDVMRAWKGIKELPLDESGVATATTATCSFSWGSTPS